MPLLTIFVFLYTVTINYAIFTNYYYYYDYYYT